MRRPIGSKGCAPRRFRPYPKCKDSGVTWLGGIPEDWRVQKLSWLTECLDGKRIPLNAEERGRMQGDYPYRGANSILDYVDKWLFDEELVLLGEDGAPFFDRLRPVAFQVTGKIWVNNHAHVLRPREAIDARFLAHALNCVDYRAFIDGTTRDKLTQGDMNAIPIQCPKVKEQRAIADFLDRETTKIDALVAKKERLIELLQEKRTALITRAVTRGLDPNVPLKDSGVEWLGEIPAHWGVKRLKNVSTFVTSGSRGWAEFYSEEGPLFLRIGNVQSGSIDLNIDDLQHVDPPRGSEGERTRVKPGDVLVSITALIGAVAVVSEDLPEAFVNQHLALIRLSTPEVDSRWIAYCVMSPVGQTQFAADLYGGTKDGLGLDDIRSLVVLAPPFREQERIVTYLDSQSAKLMKLVQAVRTAINHLKEFRTALISAAVTGKIDVREARPG